MQLVSRLSYKLCGKNFNVEDYMQTFNQINWYLFGRGGGTQGDYKVDIFTN